MKAYRIHISGIVQGVGFRPFVYRLATGRGLAGFVENDSRGVNIEVEGEDQAVDSLLGAIPAELPPQAAVDRLTAEEIEVRGHSGFLIRESSAGAGATRISPDIAVCGDCLAELTDPHDRRHGYPFINCTNCGPRLSIIKSTPYDRPATTMADFAMCPDCLREYRDPGDRRFHAQPNACPACGPRVWACDASGKTVAEGGGAIEAAARHVSSGGIAAVKGLGGFHICCDADNGQAVSRLRELKRRPDKPLALMAVSLEAARRACLVSDAEGKLLGSPQAPIVLCRKAEGWGPGGAVSPGNSYIGMMLPYAPLQHLLFRALREIDDRPWLLVMTSGNARDLPIESDNRQALDRLGDAAGIFLMHDRDIENRNDDSIVIQMKGRKAEGGKGTAQIVRHSRGYAPNPVALPKAVGPCLAVGGQMKNTFCLAEGKVAYLSQHIGEADSLETMEFLREMYGKYRRWFKIEPETVVHDRHPDYLTTRWAQSLGVRTTAVQHHHAHLMSVLADNRHQGPAIGVMFDGTGYGTDGRIWGGEFLFFDGGATIERLGHLEYLPLPGGEAAIKNPWRIAAAYGRHLLGREATARYKGVSEEEMEAVIRQTESGINLAWTSSLGRLFDAASAALGICPKISFEAQAAMALESLAAENCSERYPYGIDRPGDGPAIVSLGGLWRELTADIGRGTDAGRCAARFQNAIVDIAIAMCDNIKLLTGCETAALSGGVFQNRFLLERIAAGLQSGGYRVLTHRQVPSNDGGLALGQVMALSLEGQD
jgi:hydrogenase maturation protein HypF